MAHINARDVVNRATFPSDTLSTHVVHPLGVAALARWGLLGRLAATGCPPIHADAFRDAERLSVALDRTFRGARAFEAAMDEYQRARIY